jgi:putative serine protease PepD
MNEHEQPTLGENTGTVAGRKARKRVGAGPYIACLVAAGGLGGGVAAGTTEMWNTGEPAFGPVQTTQYTPVIVNNPDGVSAVTAAAQKASPSVVTISAGSGTSGGTGSGIILDASGRGPGRLR